MKRRYKFLLGWLTSGLVAVVLLNCSGCFTGLSRFGGNEPSLGERIACGTLDVITFPIQVIVLGPFAIADYIDSKEDAAAESERLAREGYRDLLDADFSCVYTNPDFSCPTNAPAMAALDEWLLDHRNVPAENIRPLAERVLQNPKLFTRQSNLWLQSALTEEDCRMAFVLARQIELNAKNEWACRVLEIVVSRAGLSDGDLKQMIAEDTAISRCDVALIYRNELAARDARRKNESKDEK